MKEDLEMTEAFEPAELDEEMLALVSGGEGPGLDPDGRP